MPSPRPAVFTITTLALLVGGCANQPGVAGGALDETGQSGTTRVDRLTAREAALERLANLAQSPDPQVRAHAIEELQSTPSRIAPIVRVSLSDPNPGVRFTAAMTVGELRLRELGEACQQLVNDPDPNVRMAAVYALDRTGREVDPTLLGFYLRTGQPRVRAQAAFVLGEMGNDSAIPMLREASRLDVQTTPSQRMLLDLQIAEAQYKLGDTDAAHTVLGRLYPDRESQFEAAALAAQIIGEAGIREGAKQLVTIVDYRVSESDSRYLYPPEIRLAAATALAKLGYKSGKYVADAYAADPDPFVRAQAAILYGELGDRGAIGPLSTSMRDDPDGSVQAAAAGAILKLVGR